LRRSEKPRLGQVIYVAPFISALKIILLTVSLSVAVANDASAQTNQLPSVNISNGAHQAVLAEIQKSLSGKRLAHSI